MAMSGGGDGGGMTPTCSGYCNKITANCTTTHAQYTDAAACTTYCMTNAGFPPGMPGDQSGNTIACRAYHSNAAAADPTTHCPHAGPSGGNVCGTWCENYCYLALRNCTGANQIFTDMNQCTTQCMGFSATQLAGMPSATSGDTIQCRIYHLGVAGTDATSATTHCPHGKIMPAAGTPCAP